MKRPNAETLSIIKRDADREIAVAQLTLGNIYFTGKGLACDYLKAFDWYRRAAENNNAKAQAKLGRLYWAGKGCAKDIALAYAWLSIASVNGYRPPMHRIASFLVKHSLLDSELARAEDFINLRLRNRKNPAAQ
jgi:TPR repeat protein